MVIGFTWQRGYGDGTPAVSPASRGICLVRQSSKLVLLLLL
jgi:hypothetical protein